MNGGIDGALSNIVSDDVRLNAEAAATIDGGHHATFRSTRFRNHLLVN